MNKLSIRLLIRSLSRTFIKANLRIVENSDLQRNAIIFAPHQDDETLGCGGTIIRKRQEGANIKIVFMTDGSRSHRYMPEEKLKILRSQEAINAAKELGVSSENIIFLNIKDGELSNFHTAAVTKIHNILIKDNAEEIYIPYHAEPDCVPDHAATYHAVIDALEKYKLSFSVYEYPIWYWRQYPWTYEKHSNRIEAIVKIPKGFLSGFKFHREFRYGVFTKGVHSIKREALAQHRTQMERQNNHPQWSTLGDFSEGQWLECFFQNYEFFLSYQYKNGIRCNSKIESEIKEKS